VVGQRRPQIAGITREVGEVDVSRGVSRPKLERGVEGICCPPERRAAHYGLWRGGHRVV
jgi:hypothetical protein